MRKSQENTTVGTHAGGEKMAIWQRGDRYRRQNNDGEDWGGCKHSDACRRREMRSKKRKSTQVSFWTIFGRDNCKPGLCHSAAFF